MLKFIEIKMNKIKPYCSKISLKFKDNEVSPEKYLFLKCRLENLEYYMNDEYSIDLEFLYDEYCNELLSEIHIFTPKHLMSKDIESAIKVFMDHLGTFENYYEAQCVIFNNSYKKALRC